MNHREQVIEIAREIAANAERVNKASRDRLDFMEALLESSANVQEDLLALQAGAERSAQQLVETATQTHDIVGEVEKTVTSLGSAVGEVLRLIAVLGDFRDRYRATSVLAENITDIARQTQMLSLNALLEASRSGGNDKGFSAVATEFKTLAMSSLAFAREINDKHATLNGSLLAMATDFGVLGDRLTDDATDSRHSLDTMKSICATLSSNVAAAEQISGRAVTNLAAFGELASHLDKVKKDTLAAIAGSRENSIKARRIEELLSETAREPVAGATNVIPLSKG